MNLSFPRSAPLTLTHTPTRQAHMISMIPATPRQTGRQPPSPTTLTCLTRVTIWHPQYAHYDPPLLLITLSGYDCCPAPTDDTTPRFGVSHALALDACPIIAGNKDEFLSTTADGQNPVEQNEAVLTLSDCYYCLNDANASRPYPIVTTFEAWSFPTTIPEHWKVFQSPDRPTMGPSSVITTLVMFRDKACVLTGSVESECR